MSCDGYIPVHLSTLFSLRLGPRWRMLSHMSRLWFLVLIGWLFIIGSYGHENERHREQEAKLDRECGCVPDASVRPVLEPLRPLEEMLERSAQRELGDAPAPGGPVSRLPAPRLDGLRLEVSAPHYEPVSDVLLTGELPPGAERLALLFEVRGKDFEGNARVDHRLAFAPASQLAALGKPRCDTSLDLDLADEVRVAIAGVDAKGQLGRVSTVQAQLAPRGPERPLCGHGHCHHSGLAALLLGMCWTLPTFAMMIGTLIVLARRRSQFRDATAETMSLGQLHQLCTRVSRTQIAYVVLCLLSGAALALRYPQVAPNAVLVLPFALVAALRYRAMRNLLALAERPGASLERRGPGVTVVHEGNVILETFPASLVAAAMRDDMPPMRTR